MPAPALVAPPTSLGPGYLYLAALGTTEPTSTVAGGVFTDSWPAGWRWLGGTEEGHTFNYETKVDPVMAAEYFDPLSYETDSRAGTVEFALVSITQTNLKAALNGGTSTVTGTGATTKTVYNPPAGGSEIRQMLGWESRDLTERYVFRQVFQGGKLAIKRGRGAAGKATIPVVFNLEVPTTGLQLFDYITAGTARA